MANAIKLVGTPDHLPLAHALRQLTHIKVSTMTRGICATVEAALTYHAARRPSRRGIVGEGPPLLMRYGVCEHDKRGATLVYLTRKS